MPTRLAAVVLLTGVASVSYSQVLINGDFEVPGTAGAPLPGWTIQKGQLTADSGKRKAGKYSGKIDGGESDSSVYQDIMVTPGATYTLHGHWRNGDKTAAFDVARASVQWLDAPGGREIAPAVVRNSGDVVSNWTAFEVGPVTAPSNAGAARIRLSATFNTAGFDGIAWEQVSVNETGQADANPGVLTPSAATTEKIAADTSVPATQGKGATLTALSGTPLNANGNGASITASDEPATATALAASTSEADRSGSAIVWVGEIIDGYRAAVRADRKILLFASGDDLTSQYFDKTIFSSPKVQDVISEHFVPIRIDGIQRLDSLKKLGIRQPGTVIIYDKNGTALHVVTEKLTLAEFENKLTSSIDD